MKSKFLLILFLSLSVYCFCNDEKPILVKTKISEVTVFEQSAQIMREGKRKLEKGTHLLAFNDLPQYLNTNQIQFSGEGKFSVQSIYFTERIDTLNKEELLRSLPKVDYISEIQKRNELIFEISGRIAIYEKEKQLLESHNNFKSATEGVDLEGLTKASAFLRNRFLELHKIILDLNQDKSTYEREINELNLERNQLRKVEIQKFLVLNVLVVAESITEAIFNVSYQIHNAGWAPFYEARVNSIDEPVELDYQAKVFQNSGEEWEDIILTLSSGTPQQSDYKPELSPWRIGQVQQAVYYQPVANNTNQNYNGNNPNSWLSTQPYNPNIREVSGQILDAQTSEPIIGATVMLMGTNSGTVTDFDGRYILGIPQGASQIQISYLGYYRMNLNISQPVMNIYLNSDQASISEVVVSQNSRTLSADMIQVQSIQKLPGVFKKNKGRNKEQKTFTDYVEVRTSYSPTQVKFTADVPYSIPSNGQKYNVHLIEYPIDAQYMYSCSPKLDSKAYLTARIIDWEFLDLLPGEMNVYFEGGFVGQSRIDPSFADDTLNLSLGVDKSIRIERTKIKSGFKKQFISGSRKDSREWQITVRNNKTARIQILLDDQIPLSSSEDVVVDLENKSGASHDKETGFLYWNITVDPKEEKSLVFKYTVESPKGSYIPLD